MSTNIKYQFLHFVINETLVNRKRIIYILEQNDIDQSQKVELTAHLIRQIKYENLSFEQSKLYVLASVAEKYK